MADGISLRLTTTGTKAKRYRTAHTYKDVPKAETAAREGYTFFYDCIEPNTGGRSVGHNYIGLWVIAEDESDNADDLNESVSRESSDDSFNSDVHFISTSGDPIHPPAYKTIHRCHNVPHAQALIRKPTTINNVNKNNNLTRRDKKDGNTSENRASRKLTSPNVQADLSFGDTFGSASTSWGNFVTYEEQNDAFRMLNRQKKDARGKGKISGDRHVFHPLFEEVNLKTRAHNYAQSSKHPDVKYTDGNRGNRFDVSPEGRRPRKGGTSLVNHSYSYDPAYFQEHPRVAGACTNKRRAFHQAQASGIKRRRGSRNRCDGSTRIGDDRWQEVVNCGASQNSEGGDICHADSDVFTPSEASMNYNSNADESDPEHADDEYMENKLTSPDLLTRVAKVRKDRDNLLFFLNQIIIWNLIQLVVFLALMFYSCLCVCSFRQAFNCDDTCLLRPKQPRDDSSKKWWKV